MQLVSEREHYLEGTLHFAVYHRMVNTVLTAGANGSVFGIGYGTYNSSIYQFSSGSWIKVPPGEPTVVDIDQMDRPWVSSYLVLLPVLSQV